MAKLVSYLDGKRAKDYVLDKERVSIGRKSHNDIQLDHPTVSGEHALVITIRQDSFLEDLGSTNGTRVNRQPIKKCVLQDGDEIRVGVYLLKFQADAEGTNRFEETTLADDQLDPLTGESLDESGGWQENYDPAAQTQSMNTTLLVGNKPKKAEVVSEGTGAGRQALLRILSGPGAGNELVLERTLTTLGKPGVQVAVVTRRGDGYYFTHVEGESYPLVNGRSAGAHAHVLQEHDIVDLAGTKMEFCYK
jgi:pSer/pThr/pTyr-binding forkhead associated (FHA) protein